MSRLITDGARIPRIITGESALAALEAEYNRRKAWQTGGLQLAFIEKALHDAPDAYIYGYRVEDVIKVAMLLLKANIQPEELLDIGLNIDAVFDVISGILKKEQQEMVNEALSHCMKPED